MASGTAPKINGTGKSHTLNPEARIFVPRENFAVNNRQEQTASTVAATTTTTAAREAPTTAPPPTAPLPPVPTTAPPPVTTAPPPPHYFQYRPAPVVPVVYPSVYGTPGTIFFMPIYQVPYAANLLPMKNGNGDYAYFYRVKHY